MKKIAFVALFLFCIFAVAALALAAEPANNAAATAPVPQRVEVDRNYDGVPDRFEYYNKDAGIDHVETDTDFNGKVDEWVYYKNGVVEKAEKDTNADGKPDTWMKY